MSFGTHAAQNAVNAAVSKQLVRRVVRNNYAEIQVAVWTGIAAEHVDALGW